MQQIILAIEAIARLPEYQSAALANAVEIARYRPGPIGVFMGYDFHLGADGPQLIEINTNAGGALINAYLLQAQMSCCSDMSVAKAMRIDLDALGEAGDLRGPVERTGEELVRRTVDEQRELRLTGQGGTG